LHFGLEKEEHITSIEVTWPNGYVSKLNNIKANQKVIIDIETAQEVSTNKQTVRQPAFTTLIADSLGVDFAHTENRYDDYQKEPLLPHQTSMLGPGVAVADINGDGLDDFYVGGASKQAAALYIQDKGGNFFRSNEALWDTDKEHEDMSALFFDFDNDNDQGNRLQSAIFSRSIIYKYG